MKDIFNDRIGQKHWYIGTKALVPSTFLVAALHNISFHSFFRYSDDLLPRRLILGAFSEIAYTDHLPPNCRWCLGRLLVAYPLTRNAVFSSGQSSLEQERAAAKNGFEFIHRCDMWFLALIAPLNINGWTRMCLLLVLVLSEPHENELPVEKSNSRSSRTRLGVDWPIQNSDSRTLTPFGPYNIIKRYYRGRANSRHQHCTGGPLA